MSNRKSFSPSLSVKILIWGYLAFFGIILVVDDFLDHYLVTLLYESFPTEQANNIFSWYFRVFCGWLILVALWLTLLGVKSYNVAKYPPGKLAIPLKTKLVIGDSAKKIGALLCAVSLVIFLFGSVFLYHDYVWSSSGL